MRTRRTIGIRRRHRRQPDNATELNDDELVALAQRDAARFDALYARYERDIFAFIRSRIQGDPAHIEDLTSKVFTKALAGLDGFSAGSFRGWLYRITHNVVIDDLRAHRPSVPIDTIDVLEDPGESVDGHVMRRMFQTALQDALDVLSPAQRAVIDLRLQGLTARQIGEHLDMNPEAVKSAQYRAFEKIRDHFDATGQIRRDDL